MAKAEQCIITPEIKERQKMYKEVPEEFERMNGLRNVDSKKTLVIRIDGGLGRVIAMTGAVQCDGMEQIKVIGVGQLKGHSI